MSVTPLQPNDTVLICSPAGRVKAAHVDNAVKILESWGLHVELSEYVTSEYFNFSGTPDQRLHDLQWALDHPTAQAIFAARGGYGAIQHLDKLDWSVFAKQPKLFVGYSDMTNIHASINRLGFSSIHGLMPNSFPTLGQTNASLTTLQQVLFKKDYTLEWESPFEIPEFELTGEVVGGNLSILYSLQGTPYAPNYQDKILFIEDLNEYVYHIDRMLNSFALAGVFHQIKGLIVGDFSEMKDNERPFGKSVEEIILAFASEFHLPVVFGLQVGHSDPTLALPLGREARFQSKNQWCTLRF